MDKICIADQPHVTPRQATTQELQIMADLLQDIENNGYYSNSVVDALSHSLRLLTHSAGAVRW